MKYTEKIKNQSHGIWNIGDWCVCEYKIQQIKEMEGKRVMSISDGHFSHGGSDLRDRMFPLTLLTKTITDYINDKYDKLYLSTKNSALNWPDIHNRFVDYHVGGCQKALFYEEEYENAREKKKEQISKAFKDYYDEVDKFYNSILGLINNLKDTEIDGLKIFRK